MNTVLRYCLDLTVVVAIIGAVLALTMMPALGPQPTLYRASVAQVL